MPAERKVRFFHLDPDPAKRNRFIRGMGKKFGTDNHNTIISTIYTLTRDLSNGLLLTGAVVLYLNLLTSSKAKVGYAEGIFGGLSLVPGVLGGYYADKGRRDSVLWWGGVVTCISVASLIVTCFLYLLSGSLKDDLDKTLNGIGSYQFFFVCVSIGIAYAGESLGDAAQSAILNDSLETGDRLRYNTACLFWGNFCYGIGPVIVAGASLAQNNEWSVNNFTIIVLAGILTRIPFALSFFFFDDELCLKHSSEGLTVGDITKKDENEEEEEEEEEEDEEGAPNLTEEEKKRRKRDIRNVPLIYGICDLLWCTGSGMTVKFFPIFFKEMIGLSPAAVFLVQAALPFTGMPVVGLVEKLCYRFGRIQIEIMLWYIGIFALGGMALMGYMGQYNNSFLSRSVIIVLFIVRCSALQSTSPIQTAVVMDYVPKHIRARWASWQSVVGFGWSGSAAFGGYLVERDSYELAFVGTCVFHVACAVLHYPLLFIVSKKQTKKKDKGEEEEEEEEEEKEKEKKKTKEPRAVNDADSSGEEDEGKPLIG